MAEYQKGRSLWNRQKNLIERWKKRTGNTRKVFARAHDRVTDSEFFLRAKKREKKSWLDRSASSTTPRMSKRRCLNTRKGRDLVTNSDKR